MSKLHSTQRSFIFAFNGIKETIKSEPNFRIQLVIGLLAIVMGIVLRLSTIEWAILSITIFFVLLLELLNTVIEVLVDIVSPQIQEKAKMAKDISAAMVLSSAILSLIIGSILFIPKILKLL